MVGKEWRNKDKNESNGYCCPFLSHIFVINNYGWLEDLTLIIKLKWVGNTLLPYLFMKNPKERTQRDYLKK